MKLVLKPGSKVVVKVTGDDQGEVDLDWVPVPRVLLQRAAKTLRKRAAKGAILGADSTMERVARTLELWANEAFR